MRRSLLLSFLVLLVALQAYAYKKQSIDITVNNQKRNMVVFTPNTLPAKSPLFIVTHGMNQDPEYQYSSDKMYEMIDTAKFVISYLRSDGSTWDTGGTKDQNFVIKTIDEMAKRFDIDKDRVYWSGFSSGSMLIHHCIANMQDKIAAFAPTSGIQLSEQPWNNCKKPVNLLECIAYDDDAFGYEQYGIHDYIENYAKHNKNTQYSKTTGYKPISSSWYNGDLEKWTGGPNGGEVWLYSYNNGGHWPMDLNRHLIWNFCKRFSLNQSTIQITQVDGIFYNFDDDNMTASVTYNPGKYIGEITIPDTVNYDGNSYSVTNIESSAFNECNSLISITIGNSVTSIGSSAFKGCSGLMSITIPNSVTSIGESAFASCSSLESVTFGTGVLSIGSNIFNNHRPAKVIWLTNTPPNGYSYAAGTVNYVANDQYTSLSNRTVYKFLSSTFEVDGVKYVPVSPSERTCDAIDCTYAPAAESITIGETVEYKGIQMTVKQIMPYALYNNQHIKNVTIGCSGDVGNYAFSNCKELATAQAANGGNIGNYAFQNCQQLTTVKANNSGAIGNYAFSSCSSLQTATLGEDVTSVAQYAFSGCSKLESMFIPNSVTTIGPHAFQNCSSMTTMLMGDGVESIATYTFSGCSALTDMQIGSKVATINTYAFNNCTSLPKIIIPQSVTKINDYVFQGCTMLKDVYIADRNTILPLGSNGSSPLFSSCPLDSVYIGGNISYQTASNYGYSPFYRNTSLRTVVITDEETEISANEFYGCTNLQSFKVGDGVTIFGDWAFSGCSSLKSLAFGSQLQTIGKEAFSDCTSVTEITSLTAIPPACGSQALDDINKWECTLHVPKNSLAAYQSADQWKEFFFINDDSGSGETPHEAGSYLVIGKAGVATYCPVVDVDFTTLTAVKAYIGGGFNRETGLLIMMRVYDVPAGTGLLVKGTAGTYEVPESPSPSIYSNLLRGVTVEKELSATTGDYDNYVLGSGSNGIGFYRVPTEGTTLAAGRAYLTIPTETADSRSALRMVFDDEDEATGICASLTNSEERIVKSAVYDLQGRRVEQPQRGLYISNGKKVIIK